MTDGRTLDRYARAYANGYDLSGETRSVGTLEWNYATHIEKAWNWQVRGGLLGVATIKTGTLNTIFRFHTTPASSPHNWLQGMSGATVKLMIPVGVQAAPAMGDHTWMVTQLCSGTMHESGEGMLTSSLNFEPTVFDGTAGNLINYDVPWGRLLHASAARTGANTSTGWDWGGATTAGGWMMAQIFSVIGSGSVTIKVQDAAVNLDGSFSDVAGLTTGAVADTSVPTAAIAQASTTATIRQYTRWQISLVGITSVTFALALARGR